MIYPRGIEDAAKREREFHPALKSGTPITAWSRRSDTLLAMVAEINQLRQELDDLKEELRKRPF